MTALIDGDSIVYIAAWHNREEQDQQLWIESTDNIVNTMLLLTGSDTYYGTLSDGRCFRHERYKYCEYKGNRREKEPWLTEREDAIKERLKQKWGFFKVYELEADDVVCWLAEALFMKPYIVCSPDKDLKQIPGRHYDYSKDVHALVSSEGADYNLWLQMLTGDDTDNIAGVPGIGPKKAHELLKQAHPFEYRSIVEAAYFRYFGRYYGDVIFKETLATVLLLCSRHEQMGKFHRELKRVLFECSKSYTPALCAPNSAAQALAQLFPG